MKRKQYLAKNTALFALNSIGTRLITFLLVPLYTKAFTTAEYGTVDLVSTIATIFVPIITINIGEAVMRFSLDVNSDKICIMSTGVLFCSLSFVFGTSIFLILHWFSQITVNKWLIYVYCIFQGTYQTLSCNLRGQEKLLEYAIGNIISSFSAAIFNIIFILFCKFGVNGYFIAYIMSFLISCSYCFIAGNVVYTIKKFKIDRSLTKAMAKYSIVLVPNSFMWWIMNSSDHIMVTSMIGIAANGIYAVSYKIPSVLSAFSAVFNQAWSYSAIHEDSSNDKEMFHNNMFDKLVRFNIIITVFLMCIIKPFIKIYVESSYIEAWLYTSYLFVGNFFLTIGTFLSTFYTVNKDSKGFLFSGSIGAVTNIILNSLLIPLLGIHGAALATCISYIIVFLYRAHDTKKYVVINIFKREYVIGYIFLILTAVSMYLPGFIGQSILAFEVIVILLLNREFLKKCFNLVVVITKKLLVR